MSAFQFICGRPKLLQNFPFISLKIFRPLDWISIPGTTKSQAIAQYSTCLKPLQLNFNLKVASRLPNFCDFKNAQLFKRTSANRYCSSKDNKETAEDLTTNSIKGSPPLSRKAKLKQAVRDYGATVIVFHVGISLMSLGFFYLLVSNGLDVVAILHTLGFSETVLSSKVATGGSTMVISYAVHKLFAPVRIGITLTATPLIVRHLRNTGFLKPPKA